MPEYTLSGIHIYPVKSCAGLELESVFLDRFGPSGDRRWMLVDNAGRFLSQRQLPRMALIEVELQPGGGLRLALGDDRCPVSQPGDNAPSAEVVVWGDTVPAKDAGDAVAAWLSSVLACPCRLVFMPSCTRRRVDRQYAQHNETVGFADGFPLLLISQGSLSALNERLPRPVPMNRFRPNLVVTGCEPFAEDGWNRVRIGAVEMEVAKPCSRCVIPSIDQATAQRDRTISRALAQFRRVNGQVLFGQNLLYTDCAELKRGDQVEVLA